MTLLTILGAQTSGGATYTLTVAPQSYSVVPNNQGVLYIRTSSVSTTAVVVTNVAQTPRYNRVSSVQSQAYAIVNVPVAVIYSRTFKVDTASFATTGISQLEAYNRKIIVPPEIYSVNGSTQSVEYNRVSSVQPGNYTLSFKDQSLLYTRNLTSVTATYSITPLVISQVYDRTLVVATNSFSITAPAVTLTYYATGSSVITLTVDTASYSVNPVNSRLNYTRVLPVASSVYSIVAGNVNPIITRILSVAPGSYVITPAPLSGVYTLSVDSTSYTITRRNVNLTYNFTPQTGSNGFSHRNMAVHGLFPGLVTTRSVANLGHFEIEIIVNPVEPVTKTVSGGSGWLTPIRDREIIVRVTRNGETWEASWTTSKYFAEKIISVTAAMSGFRILTRKISISVKTFGVRVKEIFVRGKKL